MTDHKKARQYSDHMTCAGLPINVGKVDKPTVNSATKYHCYTSCNKCSGDNEINIRSTDNGVVSECETKCNVCGFNDYWAYGWYESGSEMDSNCKTYNFGR
jgi:hypothetical protein